MTGVDCPAGKQCSHSLRGQMYAHNADIEISGNVVPNSRTLATTKEQDCLNYCDDFLTCKAALFDGQACVLKTTTIAELIASGSQAPTVSGKKWFEKVTSESNCKWIDPWLRIEGKKCLNAAF